MSLLTGILIFATLASFIADVIVIIRGKRRQGVILLLVFALLVVALSMQARHTAKVEAQNRALTDEQARARKLMETWRNPSGNFHPQANSAGENEGIAATAADLMEEIRCRPHAAEAARERISDARERTSSLAGTDEEIVMNRDSIWQHVAAAAYEEVRGVAEVAPNC